MGFCGKRIVIFVRKKTVEKTGLILYNRYIRIKGEIIMRIAAVISEYNPFTLGHQYHIEQTRALTKADAVIAIMSGNFVQRGEPAIFDKQLRTRLALEGGADVVLELPTLFALQTAEVFAYGGTRILDRLGCVDYLSFGSESDISFLGRIAALLADEPYSFKKELNRNLEEKIPFAQARSNTIAAYFNLTEEEELALSMPNSILAIEYIKKLIQYDSDIQPIAIQRVGGGYNDESEYTDYLSATAVRKLINDGNYPLLNQKLPEKIAKMISAQTTKARDEDFFPLMQYKMMTSGAEYIEGISGVTEGLENLFAANAYAATYDELVENVHSKRYTRTAIKRMLYNILLGITKADVEKCRRDDKCLYARVLGFRSESSGVVKYIADKASIPVITNVPTYKKVLRDTTLFEYDILASDVYKLVTGMPKKEGRPDFKLVPVMRGNDFPELT